MRYHEHDHDEDDATLRRGILVALPGCIGNFLATTLLAVLFARWMGVDEFGVFAFAFHLINCVAIAVILVWVTRRSIARISAG